MLTHAGAGGSRMMGLGLLSDPGGLRGMQHGDRPRVVHVDGLLAGTAPGLFSCSYYYHRVVGGRGGRTPTRRARAERGSVVSALMSERPANASCPSLSKPPGTATTFHIGAAMPVPRRQLHLHGEPNRARGRGRAQRAVGASAHDVLELLRVLLRRGHVSGPGHAPF